MWGSRRLPALLLGLALVGCNPDNPGTSAASANAEPSAAATVTAPEAAASPYDAEVKALGTFTDRNGFLRKYVLVAPGLSDRQLLTLARRLHRIEPDTWFWFMDDDGGIESLLASLPQTEQGDDSHFPVQYVQQHAVAHMQMNVGGANGRQWVLEHGAGSDVIAPL